MKRRLNASLVNSKGVNVVVRKDEGRLQEKAKQVMWAFQRVVLLSGGVIEVSIEQGKAKRTFQQQAG